MPTPLVALTIAGVDPAGGAGVYADLRTFAALGLHGVGAVAALTVQNTAEILDVSLVDPDFVHAQVDALLDDLDVRAVKTGFLGSSAVVEGLAARAADGRLRDLVIDPVLVRADGRRLFDHRIERSYLDHLVPHARAFTPNRLEAGLLVGRYLDTVADMADAAAELSSLGPEIVVVTGGDASDEGDRSIDVVRTRDGRSEQLALPRVATSNDHGSGCTFAAALAGRLALGDDALDAVRAAKAFVHRALEGAADWRLGAGHGPVDQLGWGSHR